MDFILNGQASGNVATLMLRNGMDPRVLRPYVVEDDAGNLREYRDVTRNGQTIALPVQNANATLRKDDWITLDTAIVKAAKQRLRAAADLLGGGQTFNIPNGLGTTVFQTEAQSDINEAEISMDGIRESQKDRPIFSLTNLPMPIIHKDFEFSMRQIAASRNGGSPLDTTTAELAARRVAEQVEQLLLGVSTVNDQFAYGGGTIYGYTDFPSRLTATITAPTASGWTGATLLAEVLAMKTQSQDALHFGPWFCYVSTAWDQYLDNDFSTAKGDNTLRDRIAMIEGIDRPRTLDYLGSGFIVILVQKTGDVARMIEGMGVTTVQWESKGGMLLHFKVMAIMVPQLRADFNGNTGIVHGTTA